MRKRTPNVVRGFFSESNTRIISKSLRSKSMNCAKANTSSHSTDLLYKISAHEWRISKLSDGMALSLKWRSTEILWIPCTSCLYWSESQYTQLKQHISSSFFSLDSQTYIYIGSNVDSFVELWVLFKIKSRMNVISAGLNCFGLVTVTKGN